MTGFHRLAAGSARLDKRGHDKQGHDKRGHDKREGQSLTIVWTVVTVLLLISAVLTAPAS